MLNENGYYRPSYDEIVATKEQRARELFGEDIDTSELTALGKFIRIDAYDLAKAYEDVEMIYYARFPNTATGTSLDRLCPFAGITRNAATYAKHRIKVYGDAGFTFGMGQLIVCSASEIVFYSVNENTISDDGYVEITVQCEQFGTVGNVPITDIVEPVAEISHIEYVGILEEGKEEENDYELRQRFALAIQGIGSGNANAIRAAILRVPTVTSASVIENNTSETDIAGRPPHSFECYVTGGADYEKDIAQAIFDKKPIGIPTCSTSSDENKRTVTINDDGGYPHTIIFSRTKPVNIRIHVVFEQNSYFKTDGQAQIAKNLVDYINELGLGEDVILSKLYEYIYSVEGVTNVTGLTLSTDGGDYSASNVLIGEHQYAYVTVDDIYFNNIRKVSTTNYHIVDVAPIDHTVKVIISGLDEGRYNLYNQSVDPYYELEIHGNGTYLIPSSSPEMWLGVEDLDAQDGADCNYTIEYLQEVTA